MKIRLLLTCLAGVVLSACSQVSESITNEPVTLGEMPEPVSPLPLNNVKPTKKLISPKPVLNDKPLPPAVPGITINRCAVQEKLVALTFDDGPHGSLTPKVLDILKSNNAKATFFVQGCNAKRFPNVLKRMVTEGHEVGNHTWNHAYLSKVSREKMQNQLSLTNEAIKNATGVAPVLMRPPGGYSNAAVASYARQHFGYYTIMWDVDTNDWRKPGSSVVSARGVNGAKPGSIILVHDIHSSTVDAIDSMVKGLQKRGYKLVTVSELIASSKKDAAQVKPLTPSLPSAAPVVELPTITPTPSSPLSTTL